MLSVVRRCNRLDRIKMATSGRAASSDATRAQCQSYTTLLAVRCRPESRSAHTEHALLKNAK